MQSYIQITKLNDFVFCPYSLYFHTIYENFNQSLYHNQAQHVGKMKHECIDKSQYSSSKRYLQGLTVSSEKYNLVGKIDIYDQKEKILIERKNKIKKIYDGYRYQLYAQKLCLEEMGYIVKKLLIYSLSDNKKYPISLPNNNNINELKKIINDINNFNLMKTSQFTINPTKCNQCIYRELCRPL